MPPSTLSSISLPSLPARRRRISASSAPLKIASTSNATVTGYSVPSQVATDSSAGSSGGDDPRGDRPGRWNRRGGRWRSGGRRPGWRNRPAWGRRRRSAARWVPGAGDSSGTPEASETGGAVATCTACAGANGTSVGRALSAAGNATLLRRRPRVRSAQPAPRRPHSCRSVRRRATAATNRTLEPRRDAHVRGDRVARPGPQARRATTPRVSATLEQAARRRRCRREPSHP